MTCEQPKPIYLSHAKEGISGAVPQGDGYSIVVEWTQAFPSTNKYKIIYNIYYSTLLKDVFVEGVKNVSVIDGYFTANFYELTPGDTFYFAIRATEYNPSWYDPNLLPDGFPNLKVYPETILTSSISENSLLIPISDINEFPPQGIIQIGVELIRYTSKNILSNELVVSNLSDRGFLSTKVSIHDTDGYDGYRIQNPFVKFWKGFEEENVTIYQATCKFAYPNFAYTFNDGYRQILKDNLNTDLSADEADQIDFPPIDYVGWHRTDPVALLAGDCVGTYYGGEQFCADGYGVGFQLRGVPLNEENDRRQEELLDLNGADPCCLLRRRTTGITCSCIEPTTQNPSLRCIFCYGVGFVTGYEQYFFPRRSDGRIMVKFGPTEEDIKIEDEGLESVFIPDCWTLSVPVLKNRDVLIRFNVDGSEEFRYKITKVTRNRLPGNLSGAQKFGATRVRRTDPIYQFLAFRDTSMFPSKLTTSIGFIKTAKNNLVPHTHEIVINEKIMSISQINQTTAVSNGHNHEIRNGIVMPVLGHSHQIILP
jgi:hypothetical protein